MLRKARIEAAGASHHIMVHVIKRRNIYWDYSELSKRLGNLQPTATHSVKRWEKIAKEGELKLME